MHAPLSTAQQPEISTPTVLNSQPTVYGVVPGSDPFIAAAPSAATDRTRASANAAAVDESERLFGGGLRRGAAASGEAATEVASRPQNGTELGSTPNVGLKVLSG